MCQVGKLLHNTGVDNLEIILNSDIHRIPAICVRWEIYCIILVCIFKKVRKIQLLPRKGN